MKPVPSRTVRKWILPLERRLCSQPLIVIASPTWAPICSMYTCIKISASRCEQLLHPLPRLLCACECLLGRAVRAHLEHQRPVVSHLLDRGERRRPIDRSLERDEMIVGAAA